MSVGAVVGQLAPAVDGIRLSVHVLAAAIWVGGQVTLAGLVPTARRVDATAPRQLAKAFARLSWPAYAVLLATGVWNIAAVDHGQPRTWRITLAVKLAVALLAGLGAWLHGRSRTTTALAAWGAVASLTSLAALILGVFLAG